MLPVLHDAAAVPAVVVPHVAVARLLARLVVAHELVLWSQRLASPMPFRAEACGNVSSAPAAFPAAPLAVPAALADPIAALEVSGAVFVAAARAAARVWVCCHRLMQPLSAKVCCCCPSAQYSHCQMKPPQATAC